MRVIAEILESVVSADGPPLGTQSTMGAYRRLDKFHAEKVSAPFVRETRLQVRRREGRKG